MHLSLNSTRCPSIWKGCLQLLVLVGLLSGTALAAGLPNVAVMPLQAKGVGANDADVITDGLISRLQQNGAMRVMERSQMDQIMKEQGFANSGACEGGECAVQVGKFLAVDRIMVGSVGILGRTYTLNLRLVDVSTGEVLRSSMRSRAGSIDDVLTLLVPESVADMVAETKAVKPAQPVSPPPKQTAAPKSSGSSWGWWVGGGTVVAAGTVAAILLTTKKTQTQTPSEPVVATTTLNTTW
jgi:TolB-like protein